MQSDVPSKAWLQNILNGLTDTAVGKLASERYLNLYAREYGISTTALRLFNVYGPGQNLENLNQGMASIFLAQALKNKNVLVKGSPDRFRDFVYIDDVVSVLIGLFWSSKSRHFVFTVFILNRTHVAIARMKPF